MARSYGDEWLDKVDRMLQAGLSNAEICAALKLSERNLWQRLSRLKASVEPVSRRIVRKDSTVAV